MSLRYALEALCDYAEANTKDRRPRDKHGPIGPKPVPRLTVDEIRKVLAAHAESCTCSHPSHCPVHRGTV